MKTSYPAESGSIPLVRANLKDFCESLSDWLVSEEDALAQRIVFGWFSLSSLPAGGDALKPVGTIGSNPVAGARI